MPSSGSESAGAVLWPACSAGGDLGDELRHLKFEPSLCARSLRLEASKRKQGASMVTMQEGRRKKFENQVEKAKKRQAQEARQVSKEHAEMQSGASKTVSSLKEANDRLLARLHRAVRRQSNLVARARLMQQALQSQPAAALVARDRGQGR